MAASTPSATVKHNQKQLFHYTPNETLSYVFLVVFGLAALVHIVLGLRYKRYLVWSAGGCAVLEVIGWVGRLLSATDPDSTSLLPYILNSLFTLFAPTFLLAANFMLLRDIMSQLGACYSRLNPLLYGKVFVTCDVISLLVQAGGGGLSASRHPDAAKVGGYISLVGIVFQLFGLLAYTVLGTEYFVRYFRNAPFVGRPVEQYYRAGFTARVRWMVISLTAMTLLVLARSVYRSIELAGGYNGKVSATQWLFVVFDAVPISLALWTLVVLHPGWLLVEREARSVSVNVTLPQSPAGSDGRASSSEYGYATHELRPKRAQKALN